MSMPNISTPGGGGTSGGEAAEDLQGIDHEEDLEDIDGDADDAAAPEEEAPAPESPPTPRTTHPKTFLWTKSGRRRSPSNLKLLSANRRAAAPTPPPSP